jgi:hypothetical protein
LGSNLFNGCTNLTGIYLVARHDQNRLDKPKPVPKHLPIPYALSVPIVIRNISACLDVILHLIAAQTILSLPLLATMLSKEEVQKLLLAKLLTLGIHIAPDHLYLIKLILHLLFESSLLLLFVLLELDMLFFEVV